MPHELAAEVAPLPISLAEYLLLRYVRFHKFPIDRLALQTRLLSDIRAKRRAAFGVLDFYVRAGELTRGWFMGTLAEYGKKPGQTSFTRWQRLGLIEMERTGHPKPLSALAVLIMRMIDKEAKNPKSRPDRAFLPSGGILPGESWQCYIQHSPSAPVEIWPANKIHLLPPATLCWTPDASPYWEEGWSLIGEDDGYVGCMRFAGIERVKGYSWYNVDIEDIRRWDAAVADLYAPFRGNTRAPLQNLCRTAFDRLAVSRLAENGRQA